jgi:hypothetical protein
MCCYKNEGMVFMWETPASSIIVANLSRMVPQYRVLLLTRKSGSSLIRIILGLSDFVFRSISNNCSMDLFGRPRFELLGDEGMWIVRISSLSR